MAENAISNLAMNPAEQRCRLLHIGDLKTAYANGSKSPVDIVRDVYRRIRSRGNDRVWIALVPEEEALRAAHALQSTAKPLDSNAPLWGIPFAVKDNIDVAGMPTTAGCPTYAYVPEASAPVVQLLLDAGAILIGKTNMDQFATGLVGTRSPHGACSSVYHDEYISGGSSSGSAVAVAAGLVSFALGTDTAGSGRVPAAFNGVTGMKPTRGLVSTRGVVPACRTLDCVSIFAPTSDGAAEVLTVIDREDPLDPFSRTPLAARQMPPTALSLQDALQRCHGSNAMAPLRVGVLDSARQQEFLGNAERALYRRVISQFDNAGALVAEVNYEPLASIAALLYSGPWVAERYAAVGAFLETNPPDADPTVQRIILGGRRFTASDAFVAQYQLAEGLRAASSTWNCVDILLLPTAPRIFRHDEVATDPIGCNTQLGTFTNFVNLADLCALATPAGFTEDGLPFGVTLMGPAGFDRLLLEVARRLEDCSLVQHQLAAIDVAVVGAHLEGQPLNHQLTSRGAVLVERTRTASGYRLYALDDSTPPKPGLLREPGFAGPGVEVEVWRMPIAEFGSFVALIPAPLGIGTLELADARTVKGFVCEPAALAKAREITQFGGWRNYLSSLSDA